MSWACNTFSQNPHRGKRNKFHIKCKRSHRNWASNRLLVTSDCLGQRHPSRGRPPEPTLASSPGKPNPCHLTDHPLGPGHTPTTGDYPREASQTTVILTPWSLGLSSSGSSVHAPAAPHRCPKVSPGAQTLAPSSNLQSQLSLGPRGHCRLPGPYPVSGSRRRTMARYAASTEETSAQDAAAPNSPPVPTLSEPGPEPGFRPARWAFASGTGSPAPVAPGGPARGPEASVRELRRGGRWLPAGSRRPQAGWGGG